MTNRSLWDEQHPRLSYDGETRFGSEGRRCWGEHRRDDGTREFEWSDGARGLRWPWSVFFFFTMSGSDALCDTSCCSCLVNILLFPVPGGFFIIGVLEFFMLAVGEMQMCYDDAPRSRSLLCPRQYIALEIRRNGGSLWGSFPRWLLIGKARERRRRRRKEPGGRGWIFKQASRLQTNILSSIWSPNRWCVRTCVYACRFRSGYAICVCVCAMCPKRYIYPPAWTAPSKICRS